MKIATVIGARPQFIKAATVSRILQSLPSVTEVLIHTGQHYDANMSDIFLQELAIPAIDYHLNVGSASHAKQTADMLIGIEKVLIAETPDWLLIYGDTNSTLAGALAAAKLHIPIAHVEAGLRSYNRIMPEEINRLVADQLSAILFAPTTIAVNNLLREGYCVEKISAVGDVMYDAALFYQALAADKSTILTTLNLQPKGYLLATIHRAENTDNQTTLISIFAALEKISRKYTVVFPIHPRTRKILAQCMPWLFATTTIKFIEPVGFLDMIQLEKNATLIVTDSGGIQKEAFFYQVPCVTLRTETEWVETVELAWNKIVNPNQQEAVYESIMSSIGKAGIAQQFPYGSGNAAQLIAEKLTG